MKHLNESRKSIYMLQALSLTKNELIMVSKNLQVLDAKGLHWEQQIGWQLVKEPTFLPYYFLDP